MNIIKVNSTVFNDLRQRVVKFLRYGRSNVQTAKEAAPFGVDSNPPANVAAVYSPTGHLGEGVVLGYIDKNKLAAVGETRLYSTNDKGVQQFYLSLKSDGNLELGGNVDFLVGYTQLAIQFNELQAKFNALVGLFNSHTHVPTAFGTPTTTPASAADPSAADITQVKKDKLKTL